MGVVEAKSPVRYQSLASMRAVHTQLIEGRRETGETADFLEQVRDFIDSGRQTGALLDSSKDRQAAQSMLDYWDNVLNRAGQITEDPTLYEFDASLAPELPDNACPYLGLDAFREGDETLFFGRQALIEQMHLHLDTQPLLAIVGPSGSGKSSVVLAGLLPKLKIDPEGRAWHYFSPLVPGSRPLINLAQAIKPTAASASWIDSQRLEFFNNPYRLLEIVNERCQDETGWIAPAVLVIDQFEEIFTLTSQSRTRHAFVDNLLNLMHDRSTQHRVIITMRSDFEPQVTGLPKFYPLFQTAVINIAPLQLSELREAIEKPAERVGLKFEDGVVDALLSEILGEPAALPLLQFSLLKLWEKRERNRVTWRAYESLKGGRWALAQSADGFYASLIPEEQLTVRRILLRMVRPGEGLEVTSNRIRRADLYNTGEDPGRVDRVLKKLIDARLVRQTEGETAEDVQVEVAHEALVRNWPQLMEWLEDERERVRKRIRLTIRAEEWKSRDYDDDALLRGQMLHEALTVEDLNDLETQFVQASQTAVEAAQAEKEAIRQRELDQARQLAAEQQKLAEERAEAAIRQGRSLRIMTGLVVLLLVAVVYAGGQTWNATRNAALARDNEQQAIAAQNEAVRNAEAAELARNEAEANALEAELASQAALDAQQEAEAAAAAEAEARQAADEARAAAEKNEEEAERQRQIAEEQRVASEQQTRQVIAFSLAADALSQLNNDAQLGLLLALEAVHTPLDGGDQPPAVAEEALYLALQKVQLLLNLTGHTDAVQEVAYSADGRYIATVGDDAQVKIWDAMSGQVLHTISRQGQVNHVAFHANGRYLAIGTRSGFVIYWDVENQRVASVLEPVFGAVTALAFAADSSDLIVGYENGSARYWSLNNPLDPRVIHNQFREHEGMITDVAFAPDGIHYATAGQDGRIVLHQIENGATLFTLGPLPVITEADNVDNDPLSVNAIAFLPNAENDAPLLFAGMSDGTARVWDWQAQTLLDTWTGHANAVLDIALSPEGGRFVTASSDRTAKVWDVETGRALYTLTGHTGSISSIAFAPDGSRFVTASVDNTARVWDVIPGLTPAVLTGHTAGVNDVVVNAERSLIVTAGQDGTAKVWRFDNGELVRTLGAHNGPVNRLALSPNGRFLASASDDQVANVWDLNDFSLVANFIIHQAPLTDVAFSPDSTLIATGSEDGMVRLWGLDNVASPIASFEFPDQSEIRAVAFDPQGVQMAIGDVNGRIGIWTIADQTFVTTIAAHNQAINDLVFAADSTLYSASDDGTAKRWNVQTEELTLTFSGHGGTVVGLALSADGTRLATTSSDRTTKLWNTDTGQTVRTLFGHTSTVNGVVFYESDEAAFVVTGSTDRTAQVVELESIEDLFVLGVDLVKRPLTEAECQQYLPELDCFTVTLGEE